MCQTTYQPMLKFTVPYSSFVKSKSDLVAKFSKQLFKLRTLISLSKSTAKFHTQITVHFRSFCFSIKSITSSIIIDSSLYIVQNVISLTILQCTPIIIEFIYNTWEFIYFPLYFIAVTLSSRYLHLREQPPTIYKVLYTSVKTPSLFSSLEKQSQPLYTWNTAVSQEPLP